MPSKKISQLTELPTGASGDKIPIVDVSDTTHGADGTTKWIDWDNLPAGGGGSGDSWSDAVDADIVPDADGTRDLGSTANRFAELHVDTIDLNGRSITGTESFVIACSDETTALTTGTAKVTFRMPYAFTLTGVRASVTTAPTGSVLTVDINESGTTILSTKLTIDAGEKTSTTAATAAVISDASLADDAEMTIDIDGVGSTVAGAGLKVTLIGYQT